jgi:hypothetical protein
VGRDADLVGAGVAVVADHRAHGVAAVPDVVARASDGLPQTWEGSNQL